MNSIICILTWYYGFFQCLILGILVLFVKQLYLQCVLGVKKMKSACEDPASKLFFFLLPHKTKV